MPKKTTQIQQGELVSTVVFDETHEFSETQLRFTIDLAEFRDAMEQYATWLMRVRNIPDERGLEFLTYKDPVVQVAYNNISESYPEDERMKIAIDMARNHYKKMHEGIINEAMLLSITTNNDLDNVTPIEYEEPEVKKLPGLGEPLPTPKRDTRDSVELRLMKLYAILFRDIVKWQELSDKITRQLSVWLNKVDRSSTGLSFR